MKKLLIIIFALLSMFSTANATTWSGTCGDNLTWTLNSEDSTLRIIGSGAMTNWSETNLQPWYRQRSYIKTVVFPSNITNIGSCAFFHCSNLTSITIPNTVKTIGTEAFAFTSLTTITIPASVTTISETDVFLSSTLVAIVVAAGSTSYATVDGVLFNYNKTKLVCYPSAKPGTSYVIPNTVTSIFPDLFRNNTSLTSITIPASVTYIGQGAFSCASLQNIIVASGNTNFSSTGGVLFNKDKTTILAYPAGKTASTYTIPNTVKTIFERCFTRVPSLTSVTIPTSVTTIKSAAFWYMPNMPYINIPASVTSISAGFASGSKVKGFRVASSNPNYSSQKGVLYNKNKTTLMAYPIDSAATTFTIPTSVKEILPSAFHSSSLKTINLPSGLTTIGSRTFISCSKLMSINIPASVTNIGSSAFSGCTSMLDIIMNTPTPPTVGTDVFYDSYDKALAVPCGATAAYQADAIFGQFENIIEQCYYDVTVASESTSKGTTTGGGTHLLGGRVIEISATPAAGYQFDHWSDGNTSNPRNYLVENTATITAHFVPLCDIAVETNDANLGSVSVVVNP